MNVTPDLKILQHLCIAAPLGRKGHQRTFVPGGGKVQHVPVQLPRSHQERQGVAPGLLLHHAVHDHEAQGALHEGGDGFHADGEGVPGCVAGVGLGVLLPCERWIPFNFSDPGAELKRVR